MASSTAHSDNGPPTSPTLLGRLQSWDDTAAWKLFADRYSYLLERWSRRRLDNLADVDEVNQRVMWELARRLTVFRYNPAQSFRGWLRTLHDRRLLDFLKAEKRRRAREAQVAQVRRPQSLPAIKGIRRDGSEAAVESPWMSPAMLRAREIESSVRARVSPATWAVFYEIAIEGQSIADTARRHSMRYASAFAAYSRVCRMLRQEADE